MLHNKTEIHVVSRRSSFHLQKRWPVRSKGAVPMAYVYFSAYTLDLILH